MSRFRILFSIVLLLGGGLMACESARPPTAVPSPSIGFPLRPPASTAGAALPAQPIPFSLEQVPSIEGLVAHLEADAQGNPNAAHYLNSKSNRIATYDPSDREHNSRIAWNWGSMTRAEKESALRWIFDPRQMRYVKFENREEWVIHAVAKWVPQIQDFALRADPEIAQHWQSDVLPMNETTLYEALSRIRALSLVRERRTCNYGYSDLGLIEYGGETILFTVPGWSKFSAETREIFTAVWTIKEAMVIYYPQFRGWHNSCPSEQQHLENELYSTTWLLQVEQVLSAFVPSDQGYWEDLEIPFQKKNIKNRIFPPCVSPATQVGLLACFSMP